MSSGKPVAYSLRFHERQLIRANRFLGQPNLLWASVAILALAGIFWVGSDMPLSVFAKRNAGVVLLGWGAVYGSLKCLMPGRRRLKRIALSEHRAEVMRVALAYGVGIQEVLVVDSETQRYQLEANPVVAPQKLA